MPLNNSSVKNMIFRDIRGYKILPDDEQRELLREYKKTGDRRLAEKVLKSNVRYFISAIRHFSRGRITNSHPYFLEILQDVMLNVFRCFSKYDPDRAGIRYYSNVPIRGVINHWMTKFTKSKEYLTSKGNIYAADPFSSEKQSEERDECITAMQNLPKRDVHIACRYYVDQASLKEIANEYHISGERARKLRDRAINKARESAKTSRNA